MGLSQTPEWQDWAQVEARIERLTQQPTRSRFYHHLHSQHRVAMHYAKTLSAAALQRYAAQLQFQGRRLLESDAVGGTAEFIVGLHLQGKAVADPVARQVYEKVAGLIEQAVALGADDGCSARPAAPWQSASAADAPQR